MTIEVLGMKFGVIHLIVIAMLMFFIFTNILTCTCRISGQEAFSGIKKLISAAGIEGMEGLGDGSGDDKEVLGYNDAVPKYGDAVASHEAGDISGAKTGADLEIDQSEADTALDEDKMFVFANTKFMPECCPSAYTTGQGCACISDRIKTHIGTRGGNN